MMDNLKLRRSQRKVDSKTNDKPSVETSSRREQRKAKRDESSEPKKTFWVQIRIIPIWLRLILIILLIAIVAVIGLQIGYSYIGDGNPEDVLKKRHGHILLILLKEKNNYYFAGGNTCYQQNKFRQFCHIAIHF